MEATKIGLPLAEFIRIYDTEGPFELIDGERKLKMPNVAGHGEIVELLYLAIYALVSANGLGKIIREMPFVLSYTPNWVTGSRVPDLMFYTAARFNAYVKEHPDWKSKLYILVPDLVVEVVSPHDDLRELDAKVDLYLADGVRVVWVVDPQPGKVSVYIPIPDTPHTKQQTTLSGDDILSGGALIPGFEMPVADLFV